MKNKLLFLLLMLGISNNLSAMKRIVSVIDFAFSPSSFTAIVGDTVMWVWGNGTHTTTSTSVPAGANSWDSPINSSSTSFTYVIAVAGTYNFKCTIHSFTGTFTASAASSSSVGAVNESQAINIFPNPVSRLLNVQFNLPGLPESIMLYDLNGKQILKKENPAPQVDLDLSAIPSGKYIIAGKQGETIFRKELIVIH